MTLIIALTVNVIICLFALYWLISEEIRDHKYQIMNKLKWIEKQNNLLREEVNELRLQVNDMWKKTQKIIDNKD